MAGCKKLSSSYLLRHQLAFKPWRQVIKNAHGCLHLYCRLCTSTALCAPRLLSVHLSCRLCTSPALCTSLNLTCPLCTSPALCAPHLRSLNFTCPLCIHLTCPLQFKDDPGGLKLKHTRKGLLSMVGCLHAGRDVCRSHLGASPGGCSSCTAELAWLRSRQCGMGWTTRHGCQESQRARRQHQSRQPGSSSDCDAPTVGRRGLGAAPTHELLIGCRCNPAPSSALAHCRRPTWGPTPTPTIRK